MKPIIQPGAIERRTFQLAELRVDEGAEWPITGYAAVFNSLSQDLGGFRERIRRGFFSKALETADVRALINHDPNLILGRNRAGTLRVWEDDHGLGCAIRPPETQYARDLRVSMQRGDVDAMSFSFVALTDEWRMEEGVTVRELVECAGLYDVSVVTYPAYLATSAAARSWLMTVDWSQTSQRSALESIAPYLAIHAAPLTESISRAREGQASPEDRTRIEHFISQLRSLLPSAQEGDAAAGRNGAQGRTEILRRWLDIARSQNQ